MIAARFASATFTDALRAVLEAVPPSPTEEIPLSGGRCRVVAEAVLAQDDLVPFPRAAMDGYAVRAADGRGPFVLASPILAGSLDGPHRCGTATPIATGAQLPEGADAVVCDEQSTLRGGNVSFDVVPEAGDHVFPAGEDARRGEVLLMPKRPLSPGDLALLAAAGFARVSVYRRPRVAIICTGDELVGVANTPRRGQIRDSNSVMLSGAVDASGSELAYLNIVADEPRLIEDALSGAIATCDVVLTTGGASHGPRDFVKDACERVGIRFAFTSVAMKPARPAAFGTAGGTAVFVLPGNPAAAFVAWCVLARPYVLRAGMRSPSPRRSATLAAEVRGKAGRHVFVLCDLHTRGERLVAVPLANQCSSLVRNVSRARALVAVPPDVTAIPAGSAVDIEVFDASDG